MNNSKKIRALEWLYMSIKLAYINGDFDSKTRDRLQAKVMERIQQITWGIEK